MKTSILNGMTVPQLVERFTALALGQFKAELYGETEKYNRLFRELVAIEQELKGRTGDQRIALVSLFEHTNGRSNGANYFALARASAFNKSCKKSGTEKNFRKQLMQWGPCGRWSAATASPPNGPGETINARRTPRPARINDHVALERPDVLAGQTAARVAVMDEPIVAVDRADQHHHMVTTHRRHSRRRRGAREFPEPVCGQIELGADLTEQIQRRFAATEGVRTSGGPAADHGAVCVRYNTGLYGAVCSRCSTSMTGVVRTTTLIALNCAALLLLGRAFRRSVSACDKKERKKGRSDIVACFVT